MTGSEPQGWYEDPFQLHEARYFSAGRPTKLVRDGNNESYDEPPGEGVPGSGTAASWDHVVSWTPNRGGASNASGRNPLGDDVPAGARRRPRAGVLTAVAVVAIAGIVTAAVIAGKPRPGTVTVTEAMAYTATMNASSADVDSVFSITTGNHKGDASVTESGPVSWSADQGETAMEITTGGRRYLTGQQIYDGGTTYSKFMIDGLPASALSGVPGATGWTELTWPGAPSADSSGILADLLFGDLSNPAGLTSPASLLALLNDQASSVQNLGGAVLDGVSTTHYRALVPLSRLGAGTAAEELQLQKVLGSSFIGVDYWIDSSHLLRQLLFAITETLPPSVTDISPGEVVQLSPETYPLTFSISLRLSHYGVQVHVAAPPSDQVKVRGTCMASGGGFTCSV